MGKKNFIGLSILLLVLLLGLSSTTYASLTAIEIKNFILNSYAYDYSTDSYDNDKVATVMTFIDNHTTEINSLVQYSELSNANYIVMYGPTQLGTAANSTNLLIAISQVPFYISGNYLYTTSGKLIVDASIKLSTNKFSLSTSGNSWSGYSTTWVKYYAQGDIYTSNTYDVVKYPYGVHPSGLLTSPYYVSDYYNFVLNSNLTNITINGDSVPLIDFQGNQANTVILGQLGLAKNFYNAELFQYRYQNGRWKLINVKTYEKIGTTTNNQITVTLIGNQYFEDTLYSLQMNPDPDSLFSPYSQPFFVKGSNTIISGGVLNLNDTFSGDYYNNYNNDTNTENIIDSITNGDAEGELSPIETMLSGDTEDVANNFGFWSAIGPNFFPSNIYNRIYDRMTMVTDVLYDSGDVYFDFSMHGETPTRIHSSDIYLPNGALKTFISTFLIAGTCWLVWKQFYGYYELITTGNFILLFHDIDIDKTIFKM